MCDKNLTSNTPHLNAYTTKSLQRKLDSTPKALGVAQAQLQLVSVLARISRPPHNAAWPLWGPELYQLRQDIGELQNVYHASLPTSLHLHLPPYAAKARAGGSFVVESTWISCRVRDAVTQWEGFTGCKGAGARG